MVCLLTPLSVFHSFHSGLLLPIPDISMLNCTSTENGITLTVVCIPPLDAPVVDTILCSVDGAPLKPCSELKESSQTKRGQKYVRFNSLTTDLHNITYIVAFYQLVT